jgi:hypothetical protein
MSSALEMLIGTLVCLVLFAIVVTIIAYIAMNDLKRRLDGKPTKKNERQSLS